MVDDDELKEFLSHYGTKGMRWGVSRPRGSNGRVSTNRVSVERKGADRVLEKTKVHGKRSLTNKELADYNKRLELETKFAKLKKGDVTAGTAVVLAGAAFAGGIALNIARSQVQTEGTKRVAAFFARKAATSST